MPMTFIVVQLWPLIIHEMIFYWFLIMQEVEQRNVIVFFVPVIYILKSRCILQYLHNLFFFIVYY